MRRQPRSAHTVCSGLLWPVVLLAVVLDGNFQRGPRKVKAITRGPRFVVDPNLRVWRRKARIDHPEPGSRLHVRLRAGLDEPCQFAQLHHAAKSKEPVGAGDQLFRAYQLRSNKRIQGSQRATAVECSAKIAGGPQGRGPAHAVELDTVSTFPLRGAADGYV